MPDCSGGFQPVHPGHVDVHQTKLERIADGLAHRFFTIVGYDDLVTSHFEDAHDDFLVDLTVLGDQDANVSDRMGVIRRIGFVESELRILPVRPWLRTLGGWRIRSAG